jgi:hypothetical protein
MAAKKSTGATRNIGPSENRTGISAGRSVADARRGAAANGSKVAKSLSKVAPKGGPGKRAR